MNGCATLYSSPDDINLYAKYDFTHSYSTENANTATTEPTRPKQEQANENYKTFQYHIFNVCNFSFERTD